MLKNENYPLILFLNYWNSILTNDATILQIYVFCLFTINLQLEQFEEKNECSFFLMAEEYFNIEVLSTWTKREREKEKEKKQNKRSIIHMIILYFLLRAQRWRQKYETRLLKKLIKIK